MLQLTLTMTTAQVFETSVVYVAGVERGRGNFFCAHEGESSPFSLLPPPSSLLPRAWSRALIPFPFPFERLPRRLKRQSLSTAVLFRTTIIRTIMFNLLTKWLPGSNLSRLKYLFVCVYSGARGDRPEKYQWIHKTARGTSAYLGRSETTRRRDK